jgi:hypothetical protein
LGSGFLKFQFWVWVRVRGSKIFKKKSGFGESSLGWFCKKKHQNINEISLEKLFFLYFEMSLTVFFYQVLGSASFAPLHIYWKLRKNPNNLI